MGYSESRNSMICDVSRKLRRVLFAENVFVVDFKRGVYTLAVLLCLACFWFLTLMNLYSETPYSWFYDTQNFFEEEKREVDRALNYVEQYRVENHTRNNLSESDLCVGIVTVHRKDHYYLTRCVASLLRAVEFCVDCFPKLKYRVFNAETAISEHPELQDIQDIIEVIQIPKTRSFTSKNTWLKSETTDYAYGLRHCARQSKYTLILEDDTVVSKHLLTDLKPALQRLSNTDPQWGQIKLFATEVWSGFGKGDESVTIPISLSVGVVIALLALQCHTRERKTLQNLLILGSISFATILLSMYAIGKPNLVQIYPQGLHIHNIAASTCAIVYPSGVALEFAEFAKKGADTYGHIDLLDAEFMDDNNLHMYHLVPNLAQHNGLYSSGPHKPVRNPYEHRRSQTFRD